MPDSFLVDVPRRVVFSRAWGVLIDDDCLQHASTLRIDPRFDPSYKQVIDFLEVTEIRLTTAGIRKIADLNPFRRDARRAFVVPTDEAYGLSRMFCAYTESSEEQFAIFRALPAGMEWIGLPAGTAWPDGPPDKMFGAR